MPDFPWSSVFLAAYTYGLVGHYTWSFTLVLVAILLSCLSLWLAAPRKP